MTTNEGVGKKIVEALKKQSNPEIEFTQDTLSMQEDLTVENINFSENIIEESPVDTLYGETMNFDIQQEQPFEEQFEIKEQPVVEQTVVEPEVLNVQSFSTNPQPQGWNFNVAPEIKPATVSADAKQYEMPSNVAVLKKLITQLPAGVTKQTGALIIKQTLEALGISMNTVLQEAQKVQDEMNDSIKNCMLTIQEYKNNIKNLEKQGLDYQRQVNQLNDLISLFILSDQD